MLIEGGGRLQQFRPAFQQFERGGSGGAAGNRIGRPTNFWAQQVDRFFYSEVHDSHYWAPVAEGLSAAMFRTQELMRTEDAPEELRCSLSKVRIAFDLLAYNQFSKEGQMDVWVATWNLNGKYGVHDLELSADEAQTLQKLAGRFNIPYNPEQRVFQVLNRPLPAGETLSAMEWHAREDAIAPYEWKDSWLSSAQSPNSSL